MKLFNINWIYEDDNKKKKKMNKPIQYIMEVFGYNILDILVIYIIFVVPLM